MDVAGHPAWCNVQRHSGTPEMYDALLTAIDSAMAPAACGDAGLEAVRVAVAGEEAIRTGNSIRVVAV